MSMDGESEARRRIWRVIRGASQNSLLGQGRERSLDMAQRTKHRIVGLIPLVLVLAISTAPLSQSPAPGIHFVDITKTAGLAFTHYSGASGKKYLPET